MTFEAKIKCDALGCCNEKDLDSNHPSDSELEIDQLCDDGKWLCDYDQNNHYCPEHAEECAEELGLEHNK